MGRRNAFLATSAEPAELSILQKRLHLLSSLFSESYSTVCCQGRTDSLSADTDNQSIKRKKKIKKPILEEFHFFLSSFVSSHSRLFNLTDK